MSLCGLGDGLEPALSSFAASMVDKALNADLFAFITIVDTLAKLVAGPVVAALFSIRDDMGRSLGYCFLLSVVRKVSLGNLCAHAN
jgi:hypothetical protein